MTREEVKAVLAHLQGDKWLMVSLMYGTGLRLMECLRLRVQDIDFAANLIIVRDGKGFKNRNTGEQGLILINITLSLQRVRRRNIL